MTVYGMLYEHQIPKGEFLLQTAATSVLGRQIIALAEHYGIQTINVVRRKEAIDELKSIGYMRFALGGNGSQSSRRP